MSDENVFIIVVLGVTALVAWLYISSRDNKSQMELKNKDLEIEKMRLEVQKEINKRAVK